MKTYREAKTDKEKKRGKSTDELSFDETLNFFKKRGKEKNASKFRWRGDTYNLKGEKISTSPKTSKKPAQPETAQVTSDTPVETPMGDPRRGSVEPSAEVEQAKTTLLRSANTDYDTWESKTRAERREMGLPETTVGWQNQALLDDPIAWMKKQLGFGPAKTKTLRS